MSSDTELDTMFIRWLISAIAHFLVISYKLKTLLRFVLFSGSKVSMFDFLFWPFFERIPMLAVLKEDPTLDLDPAELPTLTSWAKAMKERPEVAATAFDPSSHAVFYKGYLFGEADYDLFLEE